MRVKKSVNGLLAVVGITFAIGFQGCEKEEIRQEINVNISTLRFTAVNNAEDFIPRVLEAKSYGPVLTLTCTQNTTVNGITTSHTYTTKSNELLVRMGDEVTITFIPSEDEETTATFTLPDGSTRTVSVEVPSFSWTVPEGIVTESVITGKSSYEKDGHTVYPTGEITLIGLNEDTVEDK